MSSADLKATPKFLDTAGTKQAPCSSSAHNSVTSNVHYKHKEFESIEIGFSLKKNIIYKYNPKRLT